MENGATMSDADSKQMIRWTPDSGALQILRTTICKGFTDDEFKYSMEVVKSVGLNPIKRECWFIKIGDKIQTMTGINGYFTIANAHWAYDGMEEDVVIDEKTGHPIMAWCKVYRKDRSKPQEGKALFKEYFDSTKTLWKQKPCMMLMKVAESIALRKAFPQELNGTYTEEEMPKEYSHAAAPITSVTDKITGTTYEVGKKFETPEGSAEVISITPKMVEEIKATQSTTSATNWTEFPYCYELPKASKEKFAQFIAILKSNKAKFRGKKNKDGTPNEGGNDRWYSYMFIEELSQYVSDNSEYNDKSKALGDIFDGDDMPNF